MDELKTTTKLVKRVLETVPATRSSDNLLYTEVIDFIGKRTGRNICQLSIKTVLNNLKPLELPSIETVGRCRRKLQAQYPHLRADAEVEAFRSEREEEFRDWAVK